MFSLRFTSTLVHLVGAIAAIFCSSKSNADDVPFFIGTYTKGSSSGIYRSHLNLETGKMTPPELVASIDNPSFLCIHPTLDVLYAVSEMRAQGQRLNSQIVAYKISDNGLQELGGSESGGQGPCYVSTSHDGRFVFAANYSSGSIISIATDPDGALGSAVSKIQHVGKSINPRRQSGPHAHCILPDPSGKFVCAVDLGLDQVLVYGFDKQSGELAIVSRYATQPGFGPRHIAFHPDGKRAFLINELASKLTRLNWDSNLGKLSDVSTVSTLPENFESSNSTAEVLIHPNGKWIYGSNRGHDSIAVFHADEKTNKLELVDHCLTQGETPRNFRIDPSGTILLAENQNSHTIVSFFINPDDGTLRPTNHRAQLNSPVCIKFWSQQ